MVKLTPVSSMCAITRVGHGVWRIGKDGARVRNIKLSKSVTDYATLSIKGDGTPEHTTIYTDNGSALKNVEKTVITVDASEPFAKVDLYGLCGGIELEAKPNQFTLLSLSYDRRSELVAYMTHIIMTDAKYNLYPMYKQLDEPKPKFNEYVIFMTIEQNPIVKELLELCSAEYFVHSPDYEGYTRLDDQLKFLYIRLEEGIE